MEMYRQRRDSTILLSCDSTTILRRADIVSIMEHVFGGRVMREKMVSIGELNPRRWEVVLSDNDAVSRVIAMSRLSHRGITVRVEPLRRQPRRLRIKRIPMCIPHGTITELLQRRGVQVSSISYDVDPDDGFATNTRLATVDTNDWNVVPDVLPWSFDGLRGSALVFLAGRPPRCHRCYDRGHLVKDCPVPYCFQCRRTGHTQSAECASHRPTWADRAGSANLEHEDGEEVEHDDGEVATQQTTHGESAIAGPSAAPSNAADNTPTADPPAGADSVASVDDRSDADDDDAQGGETSAFESDVGVDAEGFRRPASQLRRQRKSRKRAAKTSPTATGAVSAPPPRKVSATETETPAPTAAAAAAAPAAASAGGAGDGSGGATKDSGDAALSTSDTSADPTVRQHSRSRVPSGRRQTKSTPGGEVIM